MRFIETLKLAVAAIWAHKLRSALTLLGMIIGVAAVVVVVSLIQGFNAYIDEKIANIGAKSYTIGRFSMDDFKDTDSIAAAQRRNKELSLADYEFLKGRLTLTEKFAAGARPQRAQIKRGNEILEEVGVDGKEPMLGEIEKVDVADGRYFTEIENKEAARVAFIGSDVADKLFPGADPVGGEIFINALPYRVVGVRTAKGTIFGIPQDTFVTLPLMTYRRNFGALINWRSLYMQGTAKDDKQFQDAVDEARQWMRIRRGLEKGEKDSFGIFTPDSITGLRDRLFGTIFIVAIAVPAIALVVGGIVVMNIMLVSVTERTHEIGIRKALGARRADILKQFLTEAATLTLLGGLCGMLFGWIISVVARIVFPSLVTEVPLWAALVGVGVSVGVGLFFGIWPANKAARLDPV